MTARSESVGFKEKTEQGIGTVPVLAAQVIYKGSSVFADATSGYGQTNDGTTITIANGDIFLGIAYEEVDNTDGASGDVDVRYIRENTLLLPISDGSLTQANVGDAVYVNNVTDNSTFTLTSDAAQPQVTIGRIVEHEDDDNAWVQLSRTPVVAANGV